MNGNFDFVPTESLVPYRLNNKVHGEEEVARIANSISEFGWTFPILVDERREVLAGHKRLLAAKKLGMKEVPIIVKGGLTEAQKKAYRIIDNKSSEESPWDLQNLQLDLQSLDELKFDLEPFIKEDFELETEEPEVTEDEGPWGEPAKVDVKKGDAIQLGRHRLVCGDSNSKSDVETLLEGKTPVLMVTDPPYGVEYDPTWREDYDGNYGTRATGKVANDHVVDWGGAVSLYNAPVIYCWHAGVFAAEVAQFLKRIGYQIISQIIWNKPIFVFGRGDYHWKHEPCWYAVKKGQRHNYQGDRTQSTVWDIANNNAYSQEKEERTGHGTQKPIECMARPIRNNSAAGDLIVDPFLGSGTTLIAAEQLGRTCYGMEFEPKYCQMIIDRYHRHCEKAELPFECFINGEPYYG